MAPCNGTTSTPAKLAVTLPPTIEHYNGTLQWPLPQSWPSPSPPPTPCNSTRQWHPAMAPRPLPQSWPFPPHLATAPSSGTQQWHHVHCTLQWHPGATSNPPNKVVRRPPPLLEVRTPIASAIWGKKILLMEEILHHLGCIKSCK